MLIGVIVLLSVPACMLRQIWQYEQPLECTAMFHGVKVITISQAKVALQQPTHNFIDDSAPKHLAGQYHSLLMSEISVVW
jgi:hypothetical protein